MRCVSLALAGCVILSACAPTVWDKPGATQAQVNQDSARCRLVARGINPGGFYAEGSSGLATGAAVGNAFGSAVNTAATYQDCMFSIGYKQEIPQRVATVKPVSDKFKPISDKLNACAASVYASPAAMPLRMHSPLDVDQLSPKQLSDPAFASDAVIAAIAAVHPRIHQCQQAALAALRSAQPALVPVITTTFVQTEQALNQFRARRITWGDYNRQRRSIAEALRAQLLVALQQ